MVAEKPNLFSPLKIRDITLKNRIGVSPMCQYSSVDGFANDWHLVHLGSRAVGGAALVICEASGVEARGRITPDDLGIYKDEHIEMLKKITSFIEEWGAVPGIQLAHAGRKGSTLNPWKAASRHAKVDLKDDEGGWEVVGPSPVPFNPEWRNPHELTISEIKEIQEKFRLATQRAIKAGFKWVELHAAHGYLLNSFYSPLSNFRKDEYGGSFENRIRFVVETARIIRSEWPAGYPMSVRLSATDWVDGGWTIEDSVALSKILKAEGVDVIDCSSGNVRAGDRYPYAPGFQVPLAAQVKAEANILAAAVGMITEPEQANQIIQKDQADIVLLARELMRDPYWPLRAAKQLGLPATEALPRRYTYAL
ncbi:MAG: NADH:flavin oxidoreductase/NADH oxidase [Cyanobacteria bacterium SZAS LIN-5]|nr:NADH:flavin oxidoreductase/NADH oxidase [Cyanobacteria bacterium SZAS LIN-5]RTL44994.1 MAG: NADH:flavin oxidoreductase/NADH oxidase [Candidatus Melainabacteria bacterium]